ncbi:MAG TPA: vanadium-dependent haloperoxidase [Anditalea sp.]|nr:vanadium-dependent haloperoxidase [Anditalea sp.]
MIYFKNFQKYIALSAKLGFGTIVILMMTIFYSCNSQEPEPILSQEIAEVIDQVTEIMVHDVTNPPLAARFYSYICLAGMEAIRPGDDSLSALMANINGYISDTEIINPNIDPRMSAIFAMLHTAKKLQPSGYEHQANIDAFLNKMHERGFSKNVIAQSQLHGETISNNVMAYALQDNYNKTSNRPRYTPKKIEGNWYPTPPGYFPPVEPYFNTLRPFFLDSATQFIPNQPAAFSTQTDSEFFKMMNEVYQQELTDDKRFIAAFWDCNPFALEDNGHLMIGLKKISPGAHWMGIANIAIKDSALDFEKAMEINGILAMTLNDAFIACWDEKYRSDRIRPETAIRKYIDPKYRPLLQTPPFPEYLSGHSVASTASSIVLSHYFGEHFAYTDTVEVKYGLEPRKFESFAQAAQEAAISRLYGGIHYMDAIVEGQVQGKKVGEWTLQKIQQPQINLHLTQTKEE